VILSADGLTTQKQIHCFLSGGISTTRKQTSYV